MEITIIILLYLIAAKGKVSFTFGFYKYFRIAVRESINVIPRISLGPIIRKFDHVGIGQPGDHFRKRKNQRIIKWLIFEISFTWTVLTEVGKVYPTGYSVTHHSAEYNKILSDKLAATDYFS